MGAVVRDYNPSTDADAVADFFNRSGYGPVRSGTPLTGRAVNEVLLSRGAMLLLIGEDRGRIVGTIGYLAVSGRRVAREGELFAGMFVIDPAYRTGLLAGQLFTKSFVRLLEAGVRTLRVEVDPSNMRAAPLYVRVGFRAQSGQPQPDQEGYIELVSHLPGVVADLLETLARDLPLKDLFSAFSLRTLASGRKKKIDDGIVDLSGRTAVTYDFAIRGDMIQVTAAFDDGHHLSTRINGIDAPPREPAITLEEDTGQGRWNSLDPLLEGFDIVIDPWGSLRISHSSSEEQVFVDHLPLPRRSLQGQRRPGLYAPQTERRGDRWTTSWTHEGVAYNRTVHVSAGSILVTTRTSGHEGLTSAPWVPRVPLLAKVHLDGFPNQHWPFVEGLAPTDTVDFEGTRPRLRPSAPTTTECLFANGTRLRLIWMIADELAVESQPLPRAWVDGGELAYELQLDANEFTAPPAARRGTDDDSALFLRPTPDSSGLWHLSSAEFGAHVILDDQKGMVSWVVDGEMILDSPYPGTRTWGPIDEWSAALWVTTQGSRDDPEQGIEWGRGGQRFPFRGAVQPGTNSWDLVAVDDTLSTLELRLGIVDEDPDREVVAHLTARKSSAPTHFSDVRGEWWHAPADREWSVLAARAAVPISGGRSLVIQATSLEDGVLVRSRKGRTTVSLVARQVRPACGSAVFRLSIEAPPESNAVPHV